MKGGKKTYIVDKAGKILETNEQITTAKVEGPVFLYLQNRGAEYAAIPISLKPRIGFSTYDTRRYKDEKTGEDMIERHLGNKVVKIVTKKGTITA